MFKTIASFLERDMTFGIRLATWLIALAAIAALGAFRAVTNAEYALASTAMIPLVAVAWICGYRDGFLFALLTAGMWTSADLLSERYASGDWIPVINGFIRFFVYGFIAYLTAKVRELMIQETKMASHDALTGLLNRHAFFEAGESETERSKRYGHSVAVAFLDLDNFKRLNDSQGHKAGDSALKATADALRASLRATDIVARLGGDEFAVLLPEASYEAASEVGHKIAASIDVSMARFLPVSVSVGVVWFADASRDFSQMLEAADALMYEVKRGGKKGVRIGRAASSGPTLSIH